MTAHSPHEMSTWSYEEREVITRHKYTKRISKRAVWKAHKQHVAAMRRRPVKTQPVANLADLTEARAEEIYSAWAGAEIFPWVEGGNSIKQEEARLQALNEIHGLASR